LENAEKLMLKESNENIARMKLMKPMEPMRWSLLGRMPKRNGQCDEMSHPGH
jgi:hypothetical protein